MCYNGSGRRCSYSDENIIKSYQAIDIKNPKLSKLSPKKYTIDEMKNEQNGGVKEIDSQQIDPNRRRCSSLAFINVNNIFRRPSTIKFPHHSSSLYKNSKHNNHSGTAHTPGKMTAKDKKILKMILVIFLSFVICYLPITISKAVTLDNKVFNIVSYILIYLTPCINPLIYVVMSSEYRQAYKNLLMCKAYGPDGSGRST